MGSCCAEPCHCTTQSSFSRIYSRNLSFPERMEIPGPFHIGTCFLMPIFVNVRSPGRIPFVRPLKWFVTRGAGLYISWGPHHCQQ